PQHVRIDHNLKYWAQTKAIPNYDASLRISSQSLGEACSAWKRTTKTFNGNANGVGYYNKDLDAGGASDWIGLMPTWDTVYLLTMADCLRDVSLGNADLAGRIPFGYREADSQAGTGHYFDRRGSVESFGRVISINARPRATLGNGPGSRFN